MKKIPLIDGGVTLVDDEDFAVVSQWRWRGTPTATGKRRATCGKWINGKVVTHYLHRLIMNAAPGQEVDHINGDSLDNRRCNLRLVVHQQNSCNVASHRDALSAFKGVSRDERRGKWRARICHKGRHYWLGYFDTELEAAQAYDAAAARLHTDFARFNLPCPV